MKKYLLIAAAAVSMLAACTKPEDKVVAEVQITTPADVAVGVEGDIITVEFTSNVAWTVESNADWAKVNKASGDAGTGTIKVTVDENKTDDSRQAVITVTAAEATATVKITQAQKNALSLSATTGTASWDAGTVEFTVLANVSFEATSNADWAKVAVGKASESKKVTVSVDKNYGAAREAVITVQGEGLKGTYTLTQAAFEPLVEIAGIDEWGYAYFDKNGGETTISVTSNVDYDFYTSEDSWMSVDRNGNEFKVTVSEASDYSQRVGVITLTFPEWLVEGTDWEGNPTGNMVPMEMSAFVAQDGIAYKEWWQDIPSVLVDAPDVSAAKNSYSLALSGENLYVATGVSQHCLNASNGDYVGTLALPDGKVAKSITNDDKGNVIVLIGGGYTEYTQVLKRKPEDTQWNSQKLISWSNGVYGAGLDRIRARGDVYNQAVVTAFQAGAPDYGGLSYCAYWNVGSGMTNWTQVEGNWITEPKRVTPGFVASTNIWSSNTCVFYPVGPRVTDGFIFNGYIDGTDYSWRSWTKDSEEWPSFLQTGSEGNEGYECADIVEWNGHKVFGFIGKSYFPCWGCPSYLWLVNIDDISNPEVITTIEYTGPGCELTYIYSNADIVLKAQSDNSLAAFVIDGEQGVIGKYIFPAK